MASNRMPTYSNGGLKTALNKWFAKSCDLPFEYRTHLLSSIQVFGIQMVSVVQYLNGLKMSSFPMYWGILNLVVS